MDELKKYLAIAKKLREGKATSDEVNFFIEYTPQIDQAKIDKLVKGGEFASYEDAQAAIREASISLQSSPEYKQQLINLSQEAEAGRISENLASGLNLIMGGVDIANSLKQVRAGDAAARRSRRPSRPAVPQRDMYLQAALRGAEEATFDGERALAPARAEIQDQYLSDVSDAKIASGGQQGSYGAFRQLAANRRNRAGLNLIPIADGIRREQQGRYDNLLGMRADETQQMFRNNVGLYGSDLDQYNQDQAAAASLGATGRSNLRDSLYNMAGQGANFIGRNASKRKYDRIRNQMSMYGDTAAEAAVKAEQNLDFYSNGMRRNDPYLYEQMY
jgi:Arc/MetJ-type ribon-helix-helix transcriptional regulator